MAAIHLRGAAKRDLLEHFVQLAENAGIDTAERFLANAETSFGALAGQPMMGAPMVLRNPALAGMRKWRVKDFDNYLIFYVPGADRVSIVRVLYRSRDWWDLLGVEP